MPGVFILMKITYGSVCSGIEAATVAWHPLGWRASWFAEVDAFPSAVLAHHYPDVPNYGDMRWLPLQVALGDIEAPDVLVGGTPCQSFSIAGLRKGISDERGRLTLKYVELANEIDNIRIAAGQPECIVVWENVPGVLSSRDNAFGCFLAALSGASEPLTPEGKARWANAGVVFGPQRTVAWRTLDAQFFGLAQRRKRVFVVASARTDFHPAQVLLESYGMRGNTAPRREARKEVAKCLTSGTGSRYDPETETILATDGRGTVTHALRGEGFDASEDGTGRGTPLVAISVSGNEVSGTLDAQMDRKWGSNQWVNTGQEVIQSVLAFKPGQSEAAGGVFVTEDYAPTLQAQNNGSTSTPAVAYMPARSFGSDGGIDEHFAQRDVCDALHTASGNGNKAPLVASMQVRRLTPRECERLQGFPDDYTFIPWRTWQDAIRKGTSYEDMLRERGMTLRGPSREDCPDGPRYKSLGNSMATPCMRWIGKRIEYAINHSWMNPDEWL